jgi:hypothetical protein
MKTTQKGFIAPLILIIIAIVILGGGAYVYTQQKQANPLATENVTLPQATSTAPTTNQTTSPAQTNDVAGIAVTSPKPNELVKLPITVQGQINGNGWVANEGETGWVQVFDANGKAISSVAILTATTDWLKLPTSFQTMVGDRQMMSYIQTDTGYLKFMSKAEKNSETSKTFMVQVRFK